MPRSLGAAPLTQCAHAHPCCARFRTPAHPLRDAADERLPPPRQLPRCPRELGRAAARLRRLLLRRRPARPHRADRPGGAAPPHPGHRGAVHRRRRRPRDVGGLPAEPRRPAPRAGLGARLPDGGRRDEPDDAVQGQDGQGPQRQRRAVHLPGADGGRHPDVRRGVRAGGRGPAPAPRDHPRPRRADEHPLRAGAHGARAVHPQGVGEDHGPAGPHVEDERVDCRRRRGWCCSATTRAGSRRRSARPSPTPRPRCATTRRPSPGCRTCSSSTRCCPARRSRRSRPSSPAAATATSRRPSPRWSSRRSRRSGNGWPSCSPTRPSSTASWPAGPSAPRVVAEATMARVRDAVGLLPAAE